MMSRLPVVVVGAILSVCVAFGETPDEFVDYVQSDGTSYFDTGVIGKTGTRCVTDFLPVANPPNGSYLAGCKSTQYVVPLYFNYGFGEYYGGKLCNRGGTLVFKRLAIDVTFEKGKQTVYINDNLAEPNSGHSTVDVDTGLSMYLFACNDNGTAVIPNCQIRLYGFKVWQKVDGAYVLQRDYRPARKDGKVCLYDDVNKTIIYPKKADGSEGTVSYRAPIKVYATERDGKTPIEQLTTAVSTAVAGDVIVLERGTYKFPDDVFMTTNTRKTTSPSYAKIRLSVSAAQNGITIRGEDDSSRRSWSEGSEPVIIDGNGAKALQLQLNDNAFAWIENLTFVNCNGGAYGSGGSDDSQYGNWCSGGAIGIGKMASPWKGGSNVVISNCVFRANQAAVGGAVGSANDYFVKDCLFAGCTASNGGGCMRYGNADACDFNGNQTCGFHMNDVQNCRFVDNDSSVGEFPILEAATVKDSQFVNNHVSNNKWAYIATAPWFENCHFTNNTAAVFGTINASNGTVTNCTFIGGTCGAQGKGAVVDAARVFDCRIVGTRGNYGYGLGVTVTNECYVKNCYIADNECSYGGGGARLSVDLKDLTAETLVRPILTFDHCTFATNAITAGQHGGAIRNAVKNLPSGVDLASLIVCSNNCQFIRNSATHVAGVEGVTAIGCTFVDNYGSGKGFNYLGGDAAKSRLIDCDCTGGNFYQCSIDRCTIHSVTNTGVFNSWNFVTNTLVTGCDLSTTANGLIGRYTSGSAEDAGGEYVNCTFVGNKCVTFVKVDTMNYATFKNCVFANNTNMAGVATSLSMDFYTRNALRDGVSAIAYDHVAYGPLAGDNQNPIVPAPTGDGVFLCANPRFNAGQDSNQPYYAPRYSSRLRAAGDASPYTADDVDLAGARRLRDGKVDIGCYACWADPLGLIVVFR